MLCSPQASPQKGKFLKQAIRELDADKDKKNLSKTHTYACIGIKINYKTRQRTKTSGQQQEHSCHQSSLKAC